MKATGERWYNLCVRLGSLNNPNVARVFAGDNRASGRLIKEIYRELTAAYNGPGRYYHNLSHIDEGLYKLDEVRHLAVDPDILEMAWWWHDFYNNPGCNINEELSAISSHNTLAKLNLSINLRMRIMRLIIPTKHDFIPTDSDERLIVDIDLVSLGTTPIVFEQDTTNIRKEYAPVSDENFNKGRAQFFKKLLEDRPSVYLTEYFRSRYENQAQENIRRIIDKLVS